MNDIGRDDRVESPVRIIKVENVGILEEGVGIIPAFTPGTLQHLILRGYQGGYFLAEDPVRPSPCALS